MRVIQRKHTVWKWPDLSSRDFPWIDTDIRTLWKRMADLKDGDSLYPWARTKLRISGNKKEWVAKTKEDWYALTQELGVE